MYRKFMKLLMLVLAVAVIACMAPAVSAEEQTADLFDLEETTSMMISVSYTNGAPSVHFIAPNGDLYDDEAISEGRMRRQDTGEMLIFWIPDASRGQWQIVYDKGANAMLDIAWTPYVEGLGITRFEIAQRSDKPEIIDFELDVSYYEEAWYSYTVYAVLTDENGAVTGQRELGTGTGRANRDTEKNNVNISTLPSHDGYHLMVEVYIKKGSVTASDTKISEQSFSFTNEELPEAMEGVYLEVGLDDQYLKLDWSAYSKYCGGYLVMVYGDDTAEPIYANQFDAYTTATEIVVDTSVSKLTVQIGYYSTYSNYLSQLLTRTIDMSHASAIQIEGSGNTANSAVKINYDVSGLGSDIKAVVRVNDAMEETYLSGSGSMTAQLNMFDNEVYVQWYADETTSFVRHSQIYFDNIAPTLIMPEITSVIYTNETSYLLVGMTDIGCQVTVNEVPVEVDASGCFSTKLSLKEGENSFTVCSRTAAGSASSQSFTVSCVTGSDAGDMTQVEEGERSPFEEFLNAWFYLIAALLMSILLVILTLFIRGAFINRRLNKGMLSAVLWAVSMGMFYLDAAAALFAGWGIYQYAANSQFLKSMGFYKEADYSVSGSYELLLRNAELKETMMLGIWIFAGITLAAGIALTLSMVLTRDRLQKKKAE